MIMLSIAKMEICSILGFLVFTGILSYATADEDFSDAHEVGPPYLRLLGFVNTTDEDIEKFDEEMCTRNGGPSAYNSTLESWDQWDEDVTILVLGVYFEIEAYDNETTAEDMSLDVIGEIYCRKVPEVETGLKNLTETLKNCLDPEKRENVNVLHNVTSSLMKFLCDNDAAHFKVLASFFSDANSTCLRSKMAAIKECANQTVAKYIRSTVSDGAAIGGLGAFYLLEPNVTKCKVFENFQHCAIGVLNECTPPSLADLVNSILDSVKNAVSCDRILNSQQAPLTAVASPL